MKDNCFYIENLGCAKNQVDAESMIKSLVSRGWVYAASPEEAGVIVVNTCGFINDAKKESIEVTMEFKDQFPDKKVIMAGCLSQRYGDELKKELHELDGIVGNESIDQFVLFMDAFLPVKEKKDAGGHSGGKHLFLSMPGTSYIKIAEGCNNRCSYCAIPLIRGNLKSRSIPEIIDEIKEFVKQGIFEFNLIAQDLGSYGIDTNNYSLPALLEAIQKIEARFWIRLLYIHPDRFPGTILKLIKDDNRFLPYFDLPFQHASEPILLKMGRKGNSAKYLELIDKIRENIDDAVIRSTFLVGFPGETNKDFDELLDFQQKAELTWMGAFIYSREEETAAYDFPGRVSKSAAKQRHDILLKNQIPITAKKLQSFIGKELDMIVEEAVEKENLYIGRCYAQAPEVDGLVVIRSKKLVPGSVVRCRIIRVNGVDLEADVI